MTPTAADIVASLVAGEAANEKLYSPDLIAAGAPALVANTLSSLTHSYGPFVSLRSVHEKLEMTLDRAIIRLTVRQDVDGRLSTLLADQPAARGSFDEIANEIATLPGDTALYVETDQAIRAAMRADTSMAVASAFKLCVLAALTQRQISMDTMIVMRPDLKSLPSGILQDWPDTSVLTVQSLANLMISLSDNTATDLLIDYIGRADLERIAPANQPFLTTREAFLLKRRSKKSLRQRWGNADLSERRIILSELASEEELHGHDVLAQPTLDAEWFFTARDLARLLKELRGHPALSINPGPVTASDWRQFAYKGGSEPGVLNFSMEVLGHDNRWHTVVVTWNHREGLVDLDKLLFLVRGLLYQL